MPPSQGHGRFANYSNDELLQWKKILHGDDTPYYLLPLDLMEAIETKIPALLSSWHWDEDWQLAKNAADDKFIIGYWRGNPIKSDLLWFIPDKEYVLTQTPKSRSHEQEMLRKMFPAHQARHLNRLAYAGWLMTNKDYCKGAKFFVQHYQTFYRKYPRVASPRKTPIAISNFMKQWRLSEIPIPGLPLPMMPRFGADVIPESDVLRAPRSLCFLPDIAPIPKPTELLTQLQAIEGSVEHLAPWLQLIDPSNTSKGGIEKFARRFRLQHYWKILHRNWTMLYRKTPELQQIFAKYFAIGIESIKNDYAELRLDLPGKHLKDLDKKSRDEFLKLLNKKQ
jgi:hypothetical protein